MNVNMNLCLEYQLFQRTIKKENTRRELKTTKKKQSDFREQLTYTLTRIFLEIKKFFSIIYQEMTEPKSESQLGQPLTSKL